MVVLLYATLVRKHIQSADTIFKYTPINQHTSTEKENKELFRVERDVEPRNPKMPKEPVKL